jgi:hypothetical protein
MDLGTVYLQLEQTFTSDGSDPIDSWLSKAREDCLAAAERLPRLRLPGIIAIVSAVVALAGLLSTLPRWVGALFESLALMTVSIMLFPYLYMRGSYRYKRSLFLRDARQVDKEDRYDQMAMRDNNIYALEDELFGMLRRGKRREFEIDKFMAVISFGLLVYLAIGLTLWTSDWKSGAPVYVVLSIGIPALFLQTCLVFRRRRAWR